MEPKVQVSIDQNGDAHLQYGSTEVVVPERYWNDNGQTRNECCEQFAEECEKAADNYEAG